MPSYSTVATATAGYPFVVSSIERKGYHLIASIWSPVVFEN